MKQPFFTGACTALVTPFLGEKVNYPMMEQLLRRQIDAAGATLLEVQHGTLVTLRLQLPETAAAGFVALVNNAGQGRVGWLVAEDAATAPPL